MEIFRCVKRELHDNLCGQYVSDDGSLDGSRVYPSGDVLRISWTHDAPYSDSFAVPALHENQATGSSSSKRNSRTPTNRLTKRRKASKMRTPSDAGGSFSDYVSVINLCMDSE